jgi:tRNA(Arg) A34 adenosine deaminase TadA
MAYPSVHIAVPAWVEEVVAGYDAPLLTTRDRMSFVITLSKLNLRYGGGPFAAAVFNLDSGGLVAPGVNQVVNANCSVLHAEVMALVTAQQVCQHYALPRMQLVSSTEPCLQCMGAVLWSGVAELVCGARGADAEAIGFDEGPKRADWVEQLGQRGIVVQQDVMREEAKSVLDEYARMGRAIYNGRTV